ncbi:UNVERIFIED_CONTAM: hypothetical protein Sradi_2629800 [Sesamum radiatum]|uniref:Aminotransferase-like plant mobile domain-containing protein n=1 Tax=Sesamum radiatum TaxID=300843 RepID=A0AAW2S5W8_SESRA
MLAIYAPLIGGRNVNPWSRLTNSSHLSKWYQEILLSKNVNAWILQATHHEPHRHQPSDDFAHLCTLGRSIIEGDAKWDGDLRFTGEFSYTKRYWEWTEDVLSRYGDRLRHLKIYDVVYASLFTYYHKSDIVKAFCEAWCPLTNTLLTYAREIYILLWDLHELAGDEVVPSALELTGIDEKREKFIPHSSKYLFYAYHLLQSADDNRCSHVSIDKWVKFWSKKTTKYHPPPPRKEKKMVRPKSTHNPLGDIAIQEKWSTAEEALFAKLCVEKSLKEEVYLAAYLACWLCCFVLLMASLMANGRRVNLAIPVLASIYEGLNTVAISPKPVGTNHSFPGVNLVTIKTYRDPSNMTRVASLQEGLNYWRLCVLSKSSSKAWFPYLPTNAKNLCSKAYKAWWDKVHGNFFDDNITCLIKPNSIKITLKHKKNEDKQVDGGENNSPQALVPPIVIECDSQAAVAEASKGKDSSHNMADSDSSNKDRHWKRQKKELTPLKATETNESASRSSLANFVVELEDEVQSIDVGEESKTSHSSTMTPPLRMGIKRKQYPPLVAVSVFEGESFLFNYQKEFIQRFWTGLLVKISSTPVDVLSSIEDDVYLILKSMKSFQKFEVLKTEESLNTFFAKVCAYDEARSLSSEKLSRSLHKQQLKEAEAHLQDVQAKASEEASEIQSTMDEPEHIEKNIVVLKERRMSLRATLKGKKQLNHDTQAKVYEVEKDIAALESTDPLDDAIVENLESSRESLDILKEDLKSLNPFA